MSVSFKTRLTHLKRKSRIIRDSSELQEDSVRPNWDLELGEDPGKVDSSPENLLKMFREYTPEESEKQISLKSISELLNMRPRDVEDRIKKAQNECSRVKYSMMFRGRKINLMERELKRVEDRIEHVLQVARTNKPTEEKDEPLEFSSLDDEQSLLHPDPATSEIILIYGNLFYILYHHTDYLAKIIPHLNSNDLDSLISFIFFVLYSNPYSESEDLHLISLITVCYIKFWPLYSFGFYRKL
jgi:hypothetical protein